MARNATKSNTKVKSRRGGNLKAVPSKPRPPVPIRIPPDMVDRIDAVRDELIPREPYVRWLVELGLTQVEDEG